MFPTPRISDFVTVSVGPRYNKSLSGRSMIRATTVTRHSLNKHAIKICELSGVSLGQICSVKIHIRCDIKINGYVLKVSCAEISRHGTVRFIGFVLVSTRAVSHIKLITQCTGRSQVIIAIVNMCTLKVLVATVIFRVLCNINVGEVCGKVISS